MPNVHVAVVVTPAESLNSSRTVLLRSGREALGAYESLIWLPALTRDCGVTWASLRNSRTSAVATVVAPSTINASMGAAALFPSDPAAGSASAT